MASAAPRGPVRPSRVPLVASSVLAATLLTISAGSVAVLLAIRGSQDEVRQATNRAIAYREVQDAAAVLTLAEITQQREDTPAHAAAVRSEAEHLVKAMWQLSQDHREQDRGRVDRLERGVGTHRTWIASSHGTHEEAEAAEEALADVLQESGDGALQARWENLERLHEQERLVERLTWLIPAGAVTAVAALSLAWRAMLRRHGELVHLAVDMDDRANRDPLTGLANRLPLAAALQEACEGTRPFAVLALDLDKFKAVNDTGGHGAGDALLRDVAQALHSSVRTGDLLVRAGGDEFVVLLRDPAAVHKVAERLRTGVAQVAAQHDCPVTLSVGVHLVDADGRCTPEQVLARADAALYRAKRAGRDTVVFAD